MSIAISILLLLPMYMLIGYLIGLISVAALGVSKSRMKRRTPVANITWTIHRSFGLPELVNVSNHSKTRRQMLVPYFVSHYPSDDKLRDKVVNQLIRMPMEERDKFFNVAKIVCPTTDDFHDTLICYLLWHRGESWSEWKELTTYVRNELPEDRILAFSRHEFEETILALNIKSRLKLWWIFYLDILKKQPVIFKTIKKEIIKWDNLKP